MKQFPCGRRLVVGLSIVLGTVASVPTAAWAAAKSRTPIVQAKTIHLYQKVVTRKIVNGQGKTVSTHAAIRSGFKIAATYNEYTGNHKHHAAQTAGTGSMTCTYQNSVYALCTARVSLSGSSVVAQRVYVTFSAQPVSIAVNGGTGSYANVHGLMSLMSVGKSGNADLTIIVAPKVAHS